MPLAADAAIPLGDPMLSVAPDDNVKFPAPLMMLVPVVNVAVLFTVNVEPLFTCNVEPLFVVKLILLDMVPPDEVYVCVPAPLKTMPLVVLVPVSVIVPPVCEKFPPTFIVPTPAPEDKSSVPPLILKLPLTLRVWVVAAPTLTVPPLWT